MYKKSIYESKQHFTKTARKARRARKQLTRLFPHLAPRLHKGVRPDHICQHAASLAKHGFAINPPFKLNHLP